MIIVLDGPINAGKSTVGAMLADRLAHTVHIEVDALRHFAGCLTLEQAIPHALADAVSLVKTWTLRGFHVVVSWPDERVNVLANSNDECVSCHRNTTPGIVDRIVFWRATGTDFASFLSST